MGGDGQALTNKRSLLQKSKFYGNQFGNNDNTQDEKNTEKQWRTERWTHCALALEPLQYPAAFDLGGRIYSMQSIIRHLLDRKQNIVSFENIGEHFSHIKKTSDVREITNKVNSNGEIRCPLTDFLAQSGNHSFVGFWSCGHVLAISSLPTFDKIEHHHLCPLCGVSSIVVPLVLESSASDRQQQLLKTLLHSKKKRKREAEAEQ
ncbi:unnamed protein product [Phytomonas sp. Hart1]|nr:unnamed protein product [Phytomonas sp. Hart1]|eukprot:CCW70547.1 unnamed protein product [Phytomonas sp. isolate Hart1]